MNGYTDTKDHTIIRQKTHDLHMIHPFDVKNHSFILLLGFFGVFFALFLLAIVLSDLHPFKVVPYTSGKI
jgi:hypothetical protein